MARVHASRRHGLAAESAAGGIELLVLQSTGERRFNNSTLASIFHTLRTCCRSCPFEIHGLAIAYLQPRHARGVEFLQSEGERSPYIGLRGLFRCECKLNFSCQHAVAHDKLTSLITLGNIQLRGVTSGLVPRP